MSKLKIEWEKYGLPKRQLYRSTIISYEDKNLKTEITAKCCGDGGKWNGYATIDGWDTPLFNADTQKEITKLIAKYIIKWYNHMDSFLDCLKDKIAEDDTKPHKTGKLS